jgi:hypothetical protein
MPRHHYVLFPKKFKTNFWKKPGGIPFWGVSFPQEYKVHFDG